MAFSVTVPMEATVEVAVGATTRVVPVTALVITLRTAAIGIELLFLIFLRFLNLPFFLL